MVFELLLWWYGPGWVRAGRSITEWPNQIRHAFSMPLLLRTLFAPWKRITSDYGSNLEAKLRASIDNLVSRFVGFFVRILVLVAASLLLLLTFIAAVVAAVAWPFVPAVILFFIAKAIIG